MAFVIMTERLQLEARLGITQAKSPTDTPPELPIASGQSLSTQSQNHAHQQQQQHPDDGKRKSARRKEYKEKKNHST
jgi:hypothetical protein